MIAPSGGMVSGVNDAAGNPFWFNDKVPNLGLTPSLFALPRPGLQRRGAGRQRTAGRPPKPFVVTFTKAGTYKYFCDVHPGMVGFVTVKPKSATIPTAKQDAAAQVAQLTADIKGAVKAAKGKLPADTVRAGRVRRPAVPSFLDVPGRR